MVKQISSDSSRISGSTTGVIEGITFETNILSWMPQSKLRAGVGRYA